MQVGPVTAANVSGIGSAVELGAGVSKTSQGVPFSQLMSQFLQEADEPQQAVTQGMQQLIAGETDNIHDLAITVAKADVAFRLVMEVRDKLISAYQEVMRMQV